MTIPFTPGKSEKKSFKSEKAPQFRAYKKAPPEDVVIKDVGEQRALLKAAQVAGPALVKRRLGGDLDAPLTPIEQATFEAIQNAIEQAPRPGFKNPLENSGKFGAYSAKEAVGPYAVDLLVELTVQAEQNPTKFVFDTQPSTAFGILDRGVAELAIVHHESQIVQEAMIEVYSKRSAA